MRVIDHVRWVLGPPKHGWLPFRLELDDFVLDDAASNVFNDPLDSLLDLLEGFLRPAAEPTRICLWLEPDGYAVDALPSARVDRFLVRVFYATDFIPPMRGAPMTLRFEGELPGHRLSGALVDGLTTLLQEANIDALDQWRRDRTFQMYLQRFNKLRGTA